jgi:hypothetical protein
MAWLGGSAFTVFAGVFHVKYQVYLRTEHSLFESYFYPSFNVAPPALPLRSALATKAAAKKAVEYIAEPQVAEVEVYVLPLPICTCKRVAASTTNACMAELVVALALAFVLEYLVCFINLFELSLVAATVRVVLYGRLAKGLLDFIGASVLANT